MTPATGGATMRRSASAAAGSTDAAPARTPRFLAIVGPTGAGKTALALLVAQRLGGEIISLDSRQIYRGMDIGTAKVTPAERALVPHHGLDLRNPDQRYSAGEFGRDARRWIDAIERRGRVPVLAGGTGFFLRVLTEPIFREPPMDPVERRELEDVLAGLPRDELERWVRRFDPDRAEVAIAGGYQRMLRVLSITILTGHNISWWHVRYPTEGEALAGVVCLLEVPRDVLDERIRRRAVEMAEGGLVGEAARLLRDGYRRGDPGMNAVGYREMVDHLGGGMTLREAAERIRVATRRYARRQDTWFRHQLAPGAVRIDGTAALEAQATAVIDAWAA
ncbi:MAG: tRNA (adenosine(37)-N6)-dimethylallyltransferase MiaA [Gemmatimonadetes bacterium]|nr:tRNA (adenosine(37)-N6)-dimethylallyltransferase MiaA [Gemmatimonadota bacterium]